MNEILERFETTRNEKTSLSLAEKHATSIDYTLHIQKDFCRRRIELSPPVATSCSTASDTVVGVPEEVTACKIVGFSSIPSIRKD